MKVGRAIIDTPEIEGNVLSEGDKDIQTFKNFNDASIVALGRAVAPVLNGDLRGHQKKKLAT